METFGKLEKDDESKQLKKNHISNVLQILSKCDNLTMRLKVFNKLLLDKGIRNPNKNLRYMLALLQKESEMVSFYQRVCRTMIGLLKWAIFLQMGRFSAGDYHIISTRRWNATMAHFRFSKGKIAYSIIIGSRSRDSPQRQNGPFQRVKIKGPFWHRYAYLNTWTIGGLHIRLWTLVLGWSRVEIH